MSTRLSEGELDRLVNYLRDKPLSAEPEKYSIVLGNAQGHPMEIDILKMIFANVDNSTLFLGMGGSFFSLLGDKETKENGTATLAFFKFSRDLCQDASADYDLLCKSAFAYLERTKLRYLEVKNEIFTILEEAVQHNVSIQSHSLVLLLSEQPVAYLAEILVFLGIAVMKETLEYILIESEKSKNAQLQKNAGALLLALAETLQPEWVFDLLGIYLQGLSSEPPSIRNAVIESTTFLAGFLRQEIETTERGEKELQALTTALQERLWDVSLFCRAKAIQSLTEMVKVGSVLRTIRQQVVDNVLARIKDKTQIVRKKALVFFKAALETHPFVLDGGMLSPEIIKKYQDQEGEYHRDCVQFYESVQTGLTYIKEVLNTGSKSEVTEIIQCISLCSSYGIEGALETFPYLFTLSWHRVSADGKTTTDTLAEEIKRMADGDPSKLIDLMVQFDNGALAYTGFIRELTLRGILGLEVVNRLIARIDRSQADKNALPYLKLLRRITTTDRSVSETILDKILGLLDTATDPELLSEVIILIGNLDYRVCNTSRIIVALKAMLAKVAPHSLTLLQSLIDTAYLISTDPDGLAAEILTTLSQAGSLSPVVFAIGHIAIKHAVHLERVEAAWNIRGKHNKPEEPKRTKRESLANQEIRERRLSVGSRRNSTKITTEEQEEMADRVFFAKEHEIIFGEDSALHPFIDLVEVALQSEDPHLQIVGLVAMGKLMAISSEYNSRHMPKLVEILNNGTEQMKVTALIALADSIMAFSSLVGDASAHLFIPLVSSANTSTPVQVTALILIRHLLRTGMIKIKGMHWPISLFLLETGELQTIAQRLFEEAMEKETPLKILCEVIKSYAQAINFAPEDSPDTTYESTDAQLLAILKLLIKNNNITDPIKKIQDWSQTKNDPSVLRTCSVVISELAKALKATEAPPSIIQ
ncbi:hypothetical protein NEHOM01_1336 [Nematocida homosporus]|uniref:uncharacterized protein n=1 Tax=Nematocida homosporus TaxID=1912981 RepID=UPI00221EAD3A|nr:uncharacterized protein NEHOM01_1336 [Nematocida homosporus]KAI5186247.1 hypothetical protein NEHOM01_1336 [Nematocida homosporus]